MSSVNDNASNTYQQVSGARSVNTLAGNGAWNDMWYAANVHAGATTITVRPSTSETGDVYVWEISGAGAVDTAAVLNDQPASVTPAGPAVATSTQSEIVVAMLHPAPGSDPTGIHSGNPFTSDSTSDGMGWAHLITTAVGTYAPQWDQPSPVTFAATAVAFKMGADPVVITVSSLSCTPSVLTTPSSTSCTVTLSDPAPSGGTTVALSSNNASLTVPSSVMVAEGSNSSTFTAMAASVPSSQNANITATLNGNSKTTSITLSTSGAPAITVLHGTMCGPQTWPGRCTIPATTAGSLLVVSYSAYSSAGTTPVMSRITDNSSNTYEQVSGARSVNTLAGNGAWNDIWYAANIHAGATTITVRPSTSETGDVFVWEISGAGAVDAAAVANDQPASTTPTGPAVATSTTSEIVLAMLHPAPGSDPTGIHSGNPFTSDSTSDGMGWAHLITTAVGTYAPQWDQPAPVTFAATTVAFKVP
jgi:hypothetical protein